MNIQADLIPGIYNYCDAWCERCLFTSRCRSFQIQLETRLTNRPTAGDDLVQQLTEALNLTRKYVESLTRAQALTDKDRPTNEQALALEEKAVRRIDSQGQMVSKLASNYLRTTALWLDEEKGLLEQAGQQQIRDVELGLRTQEEAMPVLHALKDAWEMIRWYRTLIPVKTQSALRALAEPTNDPQLTNYHLGKAKLVLVSIDRSLLAWQTIIQFFPEKTDDLLDLMALLSRLRRELETLLPDARTFQRPGLD
jgi:hypothetical protein